MCMMWRYSFIIRGNHDANRLFHNFLPQIVCALVSKNYKDHSLTVYMNQLLLLCLLWKFSRKKLFLILNAASYTRCKDRQCFACI